MEIEMGARYNGMGSMGERGWWLLVHWQGRELFHKGDEGINKGQSLIGVVQ